MFDEEYIVVERAFFGDTLYIRWRDIRAISGTVTPPTATSEPEVIEGSCTLYLEGELGFAVNHSSSDVIDMIRVKQVKN